MSRSNSEWGNSFESVACVQLNALDVSQQGGEHRHVDAVQDDGTRYGFKVAKYRISDGDGTRRGRYWIPKAEVDAVDAMVFGVYDDSGVIAHVHRVLDVDDVIGMLPEWVDSPRHDVEKVARPSWSAFLDPNLVQEARDA